MLCVVVVVIVAVVVVGIVVAICGFSVSSSISSVLLMSSLGLPGGDVTFTISSMSK